MLSSQEKQNNQQTTDKEERVHRISGVSNNLIDERPFGNLTIKLKRKKTYKILRALCEL